MARWHLAALAGSEFVCSLDDDLMPADEGVLEDALAACRERCPDGIVGAFGWRGLGESSYRNGEHVRAADIDRPADIVKGRFMSLRRALLERVPLALPPVGGGERLGHRCDDIALSLCIAGGRSGRHLLPAVLADRWVELPKGAASLEADPRHYAVRDHALRSLVEWLAAPAPVPAGAP
jgi:hypothetical protein